MSTSWNPDLTQSGDGGTLHARLLHALRRDIASGVLLPDDQMPTHRELAARLGIGVGTVSKAYAEAERLGLLTSRVGSGTFVAPPTTAPPNPNDRNATIDLSLNMQTLGPVANRLADALRRLPDRSDIQSYASFAPHAGIEWQRKTLAGWFRGLANFDALDWRRLLITSGTQHAMALAVDELCARGDVVLTEAATFSGFTSLANYRGFACAGVAMDGEGILPDALEDAIIAHGSRVLYVQPTMQNPTTRTMSRQRREEIVAVARRHDLWIIEDDVYAPLASANERASLVSRNLVPLAALAPERTYYASSVSKVLAPGLRVGILVAPDSARFDRLCAAMRANCYATGTLGPLVAAQWIKDGIADQIREEVAQESASRLILAQRMLGDAIETPSFPTSLHAWLPMSELESERIASNALRRHVVLTPPSSFLVAGEKVAGLRLCLNVVERSEMERALRIMQSVLADEREASNLSIV